MHKARQEIVVLEDLKDRVEEVASLNSEISQFNKEVETINKKNADLVATIQDQHLQLQYADEQMAQCRASQEFALIRLKASEIRRMEIEGSFGILARPSNQVAKEIVHLSRQHPGAPYIGRKELDHLYSCCQNSERPI